MSKRDTRTPEQQDEDDARYRSEEKRIAIEGAEEVISRLLPVVDITEMVRRIEELEKSVRYLRGSPS